MEPETKRKYAMCRNLMLVGAIISTAIGLWFCLSFITHSYVFGMPTLTASEATAHAIDPRSALTPQNVKIEAKLVGPPISIPDGRVVAMQRYEALERFYPEGSKSAAEIPIANRCLPQKLRFSDGKTNLFMYSSDFYDLTEVAKCDKTRNTGLDVEKITLPELVKSLPLSNIKLRHPKASLLVRTSELKQCSTVTFIATVGKEGEQFFIEPPELIFKGSAEALDWSIIGAGLLGFSLLGIGIALFRGLTMRRETLRSPIRQRLQDR